MKSKFTFLLSKQKFACLLVAISILMSAQATIHTVQVANFSFTPGSVNAVVGDTMVWHWVSGSHTTTSTSVPVGAATWDSPMNSSTQTFQYILTTSGNYSYNCTIHAAIMTGTITVTPAQNITPTTMFQRGYSMEFDNVNFGGNCVQQTFDGGFVSAGHVNGFGLGSDDFYLVKTNANGGVGWTRVYGDAGAEDANYVLQTTDSGYAVTGPSFSYGGQTILLVKTDTGGSVVWAKTYGTGDTLSDASSSSMKQTADGGYIITGYTSNYGAGNDDYYLLKTDVVGNVMWSKTYGGGGNDDASCVALTNDGGYIICGTTTSFEDTTMGNIYVVKTDANGNLKWSKDYGSNGGMDMANAIQQTTDGGYIIAGVTMGSAFGEFATLIKTDSTGAISWTKAFGTNDVSSDASASSVQQTADGGYVFAGYISNFGGGSDDYFLVKTDANGDTLFTKTYGGSAADDANFVQQSTDGGYIIAGVTSGFGLGEQQLYLVKTDSLGTTTCHQFNTASTINTNIVFSVYPTVDTVSTGGVAALVTAQLSQGGFGTDICTLVNSVVATAPNMEVTVYPNPSSGRFELSSSVLVKDIEVLDITGRVIYTRVINADNASFDISSESKGVYLLRLISVDNDIMVKKIVVSN